MALSIRATRRRMDDRVGSLRLEVRHSGQCGDCGSTIDMYKHVKADTVMPSHIKVATCPQCGGRWAITKI